MESKPPKRCQVCEAAQKFGECPVGKRVPVEVHIFGRVFPDTVEIKACFLDSANNEDTVLLGFRNGEIRMKWDHLT